MISHYIISFLLLLLCGLSDHRFTDFLILNIIVANRLSLMIEHIFFSLSFLFVFDLWLQPVDPISIVLLTGPPALHLLTNRWR